MSVVICRFYPKGKRAESRGNRASALFVCSTRMYVCVYVCVGAYFSISYSPSYLCRRLI